METDDILKGKSRDPSLIMAKFYELIPEKGEISTELLKEKVRSQRSSYTTLYKYLEKLLNIQIIEKRSEDKKTFYRRTNDKKVEEYSQVFEAIKNQKKLNKKEKTILKETTDEFNLFAKVFTEIIWNECRTRNSSELAKEAVRDRVTTVYGFMYPLIEKCFEANRHEIQNGFTILDFALSEIDKKLECE